MNKIFISLVVCFFLSVSGYAQSWNENKLSEYKMEKADIIVKVKIDNSYYMTDILGFSCTVLEVIKGAYNKKELNFEIEYGGATDLIYKLRLDAINSKDTLLIGFRKHEWLEGIEINSVNYAFFMSQ